MIDPITSIITNKITAMLDPEPVNPTVYEKYLACMFCKNLADLCETASAVINKITRAGHTVDSLPNQAQISLCKNILNKYYTDNMFEKDTENKTNWNIIKKFPELEAHIAYKIYFSVKRNVVSSPESNKIQESIAAKDKKYFIDNFDCLFEGVTLKEELILCKNFLITPSISIEDQDIFWEYFDILLDMCINEETLLEEIKNFP